MISCDRSTSKCKAKHVAIRNIKSTRCRHRQTASCDAINSEGRSHAIYSNYCACYRAIKVTCIKRDSVRVKAESVTTGIRNTDLFRQLDSITRQVGVTNSSQACYTCTYNLDIIDNTTCIVQNDAIGCDSIGINKNETDDIVCNYSDVSGEAYFITINSFCCYNEPFGYAIFKNSSSNKLSVIGICIDCERSYISLRRIWFGPHTYCVGLESIHLRGNTICKANNTGHCLFESKHICRNTISNGNNTSHCLLSTIHPSGNTIGNTNDARHCLFGTHNECFTTCIF